MSGLFCCENREKKAVGKQKKESMYTCLFLSVLCAMVFLFFYYNYTRVVLFSRVASSIYCVFIGVSKSIVTTSSSISKRFSRY